MDEQYGVMPLSSSIAIGAGGVASSSSHATPPESNSSTYVSVTQPPAPSLVESEMTPAVARSTRIVSMSVAPPVGSAPVKSVSVVTGPCASQKRALGVMSASDATVEHVVPMHAVPAAQIAVVLAGSHVPPAATTVPS